MKSFDKSLTAFAAFCTLTFSTFGNADSTTTVNVVRVEEDWVLDISTPDANTASPQVATQMIPHKDYPDAFAIYCLNYREYPDFWPGGMEIQLWEGKSVLDVDAYAAYELNQSNESVTWTQVLETKNNTISFSIKNGSSQSFNQFGGPTFTVTQQTGLSDLNNYQVSDSVNNSGIVLGANRVNSLRIIEVRTIMSDGTIKKDSTIRPVYSGP